MAEKFGKTWWGSAWLRALTHIDYANRIPRGATYARKGLVKDLKVQNGVVLAKVQGSRRTPYKVSIKIPVFTEAEKQTLLDALTEQPAIISNLLNRELHPQVWNIAEQCNVRIFPTRWDDLEMDCSCPDWAVPCKHLAAVVYMLSKEIDNNPFLVFEMHSMNLLDELAARGIQASTAMEAVALPSPNEFFNWQEKKNITVEEKPFKRIDFSKLEDRTEVLLRLLPDEPTFYANGNFKENYTRILQKIQKKLQRLLDGKIEARQIFSSPIETTRLTLDQEMPVVIGDTFFDNYALQLLELNADFLPDYHRSVIANHQALQTALHLLAIGSIAPRILQNSNGENTVWWTPATIDPQAKRIMAALAEIVPADLVRIPKGKRSFFYAADPALTLVTTYLNLLIFRLYHEYLSTQSMENLFFGGCVTTFNQIGEKEVPGAIKAWCDHLQISQSRYQPVFNITENEATETFHLQLAVSDREQPAGLPIPMAQVLSDIQYADERFLMLRSFSLLTVLIPEVSDYINNGARKDIRFDYQTFVPFLLNVIPTVQMLDIKVFLPKSLTTLLRPKVTVKVDAQSDNPAVFGLSDLLQFSWRVAIGDHIMSYREFKKLTKQTDALLKFKGQFVYTTPDEMRRLHDIISRSEEMSAGRLLQTVLAGEYESAPIELSNKVKALIRKMTKQENIPLPATLQATLRPYQERGYSWLYRNMRIGFGSILADDMGLGKTLQTIALLLKLKEEGALADKHVLIVVPTGLLTNWQSEITRFAPQLTHEVYHGNARTLKPFNADILLTTYGVLRSDHATLKKKPWRVMVIDEAQNIKNHTTKQTKAVSAIPADTHIALSGTPVENRLSEFWSIMNYANVGYLGGLKEFNEEFAKPIQQQGDAACAERFRRITAPFMMRRMKSDKSIISDLPDKIEMNDYVALTPEQAALYQSTLTEAMAVIEGISTDDSKSLFKRSGLILQMILALKQICNHPAQYLKNGDQRAEVSGKVEMLLDNIESITDAGEKVLVFTQFKEMGDMLVKFITERTGVPPMFYHGGCSIKTRNELVERFQSNKQDKVFILSLKAAGTGLNLTNAAHVIHFDLWWNPAVEAQATDRAYRIGQHKNVLVHRYITKGTFEERIDQMIQDKKHLADLTVATGESWIGKLSNKELRELFA